MVKHSRDIAVIAGVVYFIQGALGISAIALLSHLRSLKWSVGEIATITTLASSPWVFKVLCGLLSDSFPIWGYRRKSYLILCSFLSTAGWFFLAFFPPYRSSILTALFVANLGFAATDVITDGLIVEHSTKFTSHLYQSIAWGTRSLGALVSGIAGGWLAAHWAPREVFLLTMLLPMITLGVAVWIHEKKVKERNVKSAFDSIRQGIYFILQPNFLLFISILVIVSIQASFGTPFFFFMKEQLGFNEIFLGWLGTTGAAGFIVGSLIYARWLRQIAPKVTLWWAIFLNSLNIFSSLLVTDSRSAFILFFVGGIMLCLTVLPIMSSAAFLTHRTGVESTLFAVLMSIFNLGQFVFGLAGARLYDMAGLTVLILMTGVIALSALLFVEKLDLARPTAQKPL